MDRFSKKVMLSEKILEIGGRVWSVKAVPNQDALIPGVETEADLAAFPYGLLLWPSALALAHRLADASLSVNARRVLELGCGPGLPGLIARWRGGGVTQTDYQEAPLALARENAHRNGVTGIDSLRGDWRDFPSLSPFDLVLGSDVLYERSLHPALRTLLPRLLVPDGLLLLSDPLRPASAEFVDRMGHDGWDVTLEAMEIDWEGERREIALFSACRRNGPPP